MNLKEKFSYIEEITVQNGDSWYNVPADRIVELCKALRDEHNFDCLSCLTGTDKSEFFEVVYHVFSYETKETIVLKVKIPDNPPLKKGGEGGFNIPSISDIWPSANWMERETSELLGINFSGHPDLTKLLLPDGWIGFPLRKDYKEPEEYRGMTTTRNK